ncbi:MAG: hypothetical protein V7733_09910 [Paraglaciecola polaris]|uniref:hypothetical protein n=1 Tax=Paraglaciecola polaris TaxID=222814 RepID=UPI00300343A4
MNNRLSDIVSLCQSLAKEGKKPSVGLVRSRAGGKLSIPETIKGIQSWQAQPNQVIKTNHSIEQTPPSIPLEVRVALLEKQVLELTTRLATVLASNEE